MRKTSFTEPMPQGTLSTLEKPFYLWKKKLSPMLQYETIFTDQTLSGKTLVESGLETSSSLGLKHQGDEPQGSRQNKTLRSVLCRLLRVTAILYLVSAS